jgi:hypothetical protein
MRFRFDRIRRAIAFVRLLLTRDPQPGSPDDPYAWKLAPLKPRPHLRSGAVALKEPDPDSDQ